MNGWQSLCRQLTHLGIRHVFGIAGTQNAELFSELALVEIDIVPAISEKSAGFSAIGYALGTGEPAVLLTIAGPGFCYSAAPLAEAWHDSVPLVNIVIGDAEKPGRPFQLQAMDHTGIAERLAKDTRRVRRADELLPTLKWAWETAAEGEPGPVVIFIENSTLNEDQASSGFFERIHAPIQPSDRSIAMVSDLVMGKRVLILAGRGAVEAAPEIERLVHANNWWFMTTPSGRGILPETDPLVLRTDGCSAASVNSILAEMDTILVIGAKLTHNGSFGFQLKLPTEKLIRVDASQGVLNANYEAHIAICCGAKQFFSRLLEKLEETPNRQIQSDQGDLQQILDDSRPAESLEPRFVGDSKGAGDFFSMLQKIVPADSVFVTDSGYHQVIARRHLTANHPNQIVAPTDFQSMGFGLPAAIGLALSQPNRTIVVIHGDGGFRMCAMDLLTAVSQGLRIIVCVFDDGFYGLIRMQQLSSGDLESGVKLEPMNYPRLADAVGAIYVESLSGLSRQFADSVDMAKPILFRQPLRDSPARASSYSQAKSKGRIRRMLDPGVMAWVKKARRR